MSTRRQRYISNSNKPSVGGGEASCFTTDENNTATTSTFNTTTSVLTYQGGWLPSSINKAAIKTVSTSPGVTEISGGYVKGGALEGLTNLAVLLPNSIRVLGRFAFASCTSITTIRIPELVEIGEAALIHCKSLQILPISPSCTVEDRAFFGCTELIAAALKCNVSVEEYCRRQYRTFKLLEFKTNLMLCYRHLDRIDAANSTDASIDKESMVWVLYERVESDDVKRRILELLGYDWMGF